MAMTKVRRHRRNLGTWVKGFQTTESGDNYIAFSEGNYYKVNNAVVWRAKTKQVVLRNTWTGNEIILLSNASKAKALDFMKDFIHTNFKRI